MKERSGGVEGVERKEKKEKKQMKSLHDQRSLNDRHLMLGELRKDQGLLLQGGEVFPQGGEFCHRD